MRPYLHLLDYVTIHTTSDEHSGSHPSFPGEFSLAELLVRELKALGLTDAYADEHCYVYGHLPATPGLEAVPALGLIAHMDTSPEVSGRNVSPILHPDYDGQDLILPGADQPMTVSRFPFLEGLAGETLITSDGSTLLGADDKAGIAEIMSVLEMLTEEQLPHGPLSIAFTPDEEIGEGADFFDLEVFHAAYAYTVDGGDVPCLEYENFNAASGLVEITGLSSHPGDAKGKMINALNVAMEFHSRFPVSQRPEQTEDREGFCHLTDLEGSVSRAELHYIIRDHDRSLFEEKKQRFFEAERILNEQYGPGTVKVTVTDSYYNMLEKIKPHMHLVDRARRAIEKNQMTPVVVPIRGGTDGARLSFMGLPCPNLGTGGFNYHGIYECITAERMDRAAAVIADIVRSFVPGEEPLSLTIDRQRVRDTFAEYTSHYNPEDPKIRLKINHTYRVAANCDRIARSLGLSAGDTDLAWLLGMLHDVGRFEQVRRYDTFVDGDSVSHAKLSTEVLFEEGRIREYLALGDLSDEVLRNDPTMRIIRLAINLHSEYILPDTLTERELLFCNLIRDADKVDIFKVNVESEPEVIFGASYEETCRSLISPEVKAAGLEGHAVLHSLKKTPIDHLIGHISLAYELVFEESRVMVKEQGYLRRMLEFPTVQEDTAQYLKQLRDILL